MQRDQILQSGAELTWHCQVIRAPPCIGLETKIYIYMMW